jgi:alkylation response protein AidB-like acyl-CoA dehydrogenase
MAMSALNGGRINISSCSLGGTWFVLDRTSEYMAERSIFNKKLNQSDYLTFRYSDMVAEFIGSRMVVREAAKSLDNEDEDARIMAAIAKLLTPDRCSKIVDFCL